MLNTIRNRKHAKAWQEKHNRNAPRPGDPAPDFELRDTDGENPTHLSVFRGRKPVVLIFGSFT